MSELTPGQKAPDFTLPTDEGAEVSLRGLLEQSEKGAVVYFYPKASTRDALLRPAISVTL